MCSRFADGGALTPRLAGSPGARKLLHAARQDIEALLPLTGAPLAPVFDTQQAAALLGFPAQIGYADLVQQLLGVELAKGHARTDWARRPLSTEQLAYAADDVRYLPALAAALEERLAAAGRRDVAGRGIRRSCARSRCTASSPPRPGGVSRDSSGSTLRAFAAARALAAWRERRAMDRDLPRGWVLPDAAIHELAQCAAADPRRADAHRHRAARHGRTRRRTTCSRPSLRRRKATRTRASGWRGTARTRAIAPPEVLQKKLAAIAAELGDPAGGARNAARARRARARRRANCRCCTGWRREVVGEPLLAAL